MELTYLYNSGFVLENEGQTLIFDYYHDSPQKYVHKKALKNEGVVYVFCSHSHADHYNKEILTWKQQRSGIIYIFAKEILDSGLTEADDAVYLDKLETYQDNKMKVTAYGSTDIGGSFLIELNGKSIFHAGDLNNWHWKEESTEEEVKEAENYYHKELKLLANDVKHIDLAMFPVDSRLGKDYMRGAEEFVKSIKVDWFAPMHFREHYKEAAAFGSFARQYGTKCIGWTHEGEKVEIL